MTLLVFIPFAIPEAKLLLRQRLEDLGPQFKHSFEHAESAARLGRRLDCLDSSQANEFGIGHEENFSPLPSLLDEPLHLLLG